MVLLACRSTFCRDRCHSENSRFRFSCQLRRSRSEIRYYLCPLDGEVLENKRERSLKSAGGTKKSPTIERANFTCHEVSEHQVKRLHPFLSHEYFFPVFLILTKYLALRNFCESTQDFPEMSFEYIAYPCSLPRGNMWTPSSTMKKAF